MTHLNTIDMASLPTIRFAHIFNIASYENVFTPKDNFIEITYVSEGCITLEYDGKKYKSNSKVETILIGGIDNNGKINLSIKKTQTPAPRQPRFRDNAPQNRPAPRPAAAPAAESQSFDDMLKRFMADSDSKISGCRQYEHKSKTRRR